MYIDSKYVIGKKFFIANDSSSTEYACVGYSDNGTTLIIGATFDSVGNRSSLKTFKLTDVRFFGNITS